MLGAHVSEGGGASVQVMWLHVWDHTAGVPTVVLALHCYTCHRQSAAGVKSPGRAESFGAPKVDTPLLGDRVLASEESFRRQSLWGEGGEGEESFKPSYPKGRASEKGAPMTGP